MPTNENAGVAPVIWFIVRNIVGALALVAIIMGLWHAMQSRHQRLQQEKYVGVRKAGLETPRLPADYALPRGVQLAAVRAEPTIGAAEIFAAPGGGDGLSGRSGNLAALFTALSAQQQAQVLRRCRDVLQRMLQPDADQRMLCRALNAMDRQ